MIILKSKKEIEFIREAGKIVAYAHELLREAIKPGISTFELDEIAYRAIVNITHHHLSKVTEDFRQAYVLQRMTS